MPVRPRLAGTRREHQVNYGNAAKVAGSARSSLFYMSQEQGSDLLLTIECVSISIPSAAIGTGDFRPYAHVAWGHGGTDVEADFEVTYRQRIPVAASTVKVDVFLKALPLAQSDGTELNAAVPSGATAAFRGFVSEGADAEPLYPTMWVTQMGAGAGNLVGPKGVGLLVGQQARLATLRAFTTDSAGGGARYLQLFDQAAAPANGAIPVDCFPLNAPPTTAPAEVPPWAFGQTRAFVQGLAWAVSTTPFVLTLDPNAQAFVTAELLL
jgi:hypothetical protein